MSCSTVVVFVSMIMPMRFMVVFMAVAVSMTVTCVVVTHKDCADDIQDESDSASDEHQLGVLDI